MILFVRQSMSYVMWNYYARNTDIWTFATRDGYGDFIALLDRHAAGIDATTLIHARPDSMGMEVRLLPTCRNADRPFIVAQERLVWTNGRKNMELIIGGCAVGFETLARYFRTAAKSSHGPEDHEHFDAHEPLLVLPAVYLNLRAPVSELTPRGLGNYAGIIEEQHGHRIPSEFDFLKESDHDYASESLSYGDLHGRIPVPRDA